MADQTEVRLAGRSLREVAPVALLGLFGFVLLADMVRKLLTGGLAASTLGTFLWEGIVFGMAIGLAGIGLAMSYSILQFANFAHGDLITSGAFIGWSAAFVVVGLGDVATETLVLVGGPESVIGDLQIALTETPLALFIGFVVAVSATAVLALGIDRLVFEPMRDQSGIAKLIASVGVALALRHIIQFIYQPSTPSVVYPPAVPSTTIDLGDGSVTVSAHQVTLVVVALVLMLGVHVLLQYTKFGTAMRAMSDNQDLARVTGIPTERVVTHTWLLGGALTGAAGFLLALEQGFLELTLGWDILLVIFAAVILGGIGSIYGAIAGGLTIGIVSQVSIVWLPAEFTQVAAFTIMILVLLVRPSGIFGGVTSV